MAINTTKQKYLNCVEKISGLIDCHAKVCNVSNHFFLNFHQVQVYRAKLAICFVLLKTDYLYRKPIIGYMWTMEGWHLFVNRQTPLYLGTPVVHANVYENKCPAEKNNCLDTQEM